MSPELRPGARIVREVEPRIHRMLGHPLRYEIVTILGERDASPKEIASELGVSEKQVSDQIRGLVREGAIELVRKGSGKKGGRRHTYRGRRHYFGAEEWEELPRFERETASTTISKRVINEWLASLKDGSFYDPKTSLLRLPLWADKQGLHEIGEILEGALQEISKVEERSLERRQGEDREPPTRVICSLTAFPEAARSQVDS